MRVDKAIDFALAMQEALGIDIVRWKMEMLQEIAQLMEDQKEEIASWFRKLPVHGNI